MKLSYEGLLPSEAGRILAFSHTIRYDDGARRSEHPFFIPSTHLLWRNVPEWDYLEDFLTTKDRNTAKWFMVDLTRVDTPLIGVNGLSFVVVNED